MPSNDAVPDEPPHGVHRATSADPLPVVPVELLGAPRLAAATGRLAMTFLPGKRDAAMRTWRDLEADVQTLRRLGSDTLLLLVEDHELRALRVPDIVERLSAAGVDVLRHAVPDRNIPADPGAYRTLLVDVIARIQAGERVVVACRAGLGRTGTAVACLLVEAGMEPDAAIALTRESRPGAIESDVQEAFVRSWPSSR